ncbi:MAG TPA: RagB/SusD family nutrient uptake outer membrane protein [Chitinophaga sp.]|uniref:RagB/SusD family nutrient uptake outer membrane protein n=1 Tax=Chitinophaga sp. TaxID=1869181 RepID=UPI002BF9335E|nr:RagB/SusD family nutrient uptake outer membrane protein [Chitinophaga sp.]HVI44128.1 RagB/SusD family nutrient uptake outer membrane protein [Chitinophaga sp.]
MRYIQTVSLLIIMLLLFACNKYLDVQPEDKFLENDVYGSRTSIRNALNGIYLNLAKPAAYGENYTCTALDVMAQYYNCSSSSHPFNTQAAYQYTDAAVMNRTTTMWNSSYAAVLNLNLFIKHLGPDNKVLPEDEKQLLLGEAYGLRAFVAFDLLRLFGPVYAVDSSKAAIPYPHDPESKIQVLLPANVVMQNVLDDLATAAKLLEHDPVRSNGVQATPLGGDSYFGFRNRRMNYYAVKALLARTLLYRGDLASAKAAADNVIKEASAWFPWSPSALSAPGITNPDRIFSSEVIFGLENADMYNTQANRFAASLFDDEILMPLPQRLNAIYEQYSNDYRFRINFDVDHTSTRTDKTFFKYADVGNKNLMYRKLQPLIRIAEMYYISAEGTPDDASATRLLNAVRFNRGLPLLTLNGDKQTQLGKEYQKEFWGEGQLFFYFKRTRQTAISSGASADATITMTPDMYVVPLPLSETAFR